MQAVAIVGQPRPHFVEGAGLLVNTVEDHVVGQIVDPGGLALADLRAFDGLPAVVGKDRLDGRAVLRTAGKSAIQINHMQPLETGVGKAARLRRGIGAEDRGARHLAAFEANALAVLEVDGGEKDHEESF